jgi:hypothetical protein
MARGADHDAVQAGGRSVSAHVAGTDDGPGGPGGGSASRLPRRRFGRTDVELSIVGLGGIVLVGAEQDHANRLVAEAVEMGVNYCDVAPTYGQGEAEHKLGPALQPYRGRAFLACKTVQRGRDEARAELAESLKRLRTDHVDLYQLHGLGSIPELDASFARGGAMEVLREAKASGAARYLGFSAHDVTTALAALDRFPFDSVLFPINFACWYAGGFGPQVVAKARATGAARLALKAMACCPWPEHHPQRGRYAKCWYLPVTDPPAAALALRFALSEPITAAVPPGEEELFRLAVRAAMDFRPLDDAERRQVAEWAAETAPIFRHAVGAAGPGG